MKRTISLSLSLCLCLSLLGATAFAGGKPRPQAVELREGDIIFQQSQSQQSAAIQQATHSPWTHMGVLIEGQGGWLVFEAVQPVKTTPLQQFIDRGKDKRYVIRRPNQLAYKLDASHIRALKAALSKHEGKSYDVFFEWDDTRIYCSELAWKAYRDAFPGAPHISAPQRFRDLDLSGELVKKLIVDRYTSAGKPLNMDEPIVTPGALFVSPQLKTIYDSENKAARFVDGQPAVEG